MHNLSENAYPDYVLEYLRQQVTVNSCRGKLRNRQILIVNLIVSFPAEGEFDMYLSEKIFIKKFLACLSELDVKEIPFDNGDFYAGIEKMELYYDRIKDSLGKFKDEIGMLFIRHSIDGIFSEFKNEISSQNGKLIAFENPDYIKATIKIDKDSIGYIMKHGDIDMDEKYIKEFATNFREGARLTVC